MVMLKPQAFVGSSPSGKLHFSQVDLIVVTLVSELVPSAIFAYLNCSRNASYECCAALVFLLTLLTTSLFGQSGNLFKYLKNFAIKHACLFAAATGSVIAATTVKHNTTTNYQT